MNMHNPAHPGELLTGWLDDLGVSVTAFAAHIGTSRGMYWLALQTQRDLWTARQSAKDRSRIKLMIAHAAH